MKFFKYKNLIILFYLYPAISQAYPMEVDDHSLFKEIRVLPRDIRLTLCHTIKKTIEHDIPISKYTYQDDGPFNSYYFAIDEFEKEVDIFFNNPHKTQITKNHYKKINALLLHDLEKANPISMILRFKMHLQLKRTLTFFNFYSYMYTPATDGHYLAACFMENSLNLLSLVKEWKVHPKLILKLDMNRLQEQFNASIGIINYILQEYPQPQNIGLDIICHDYTSPRMILNFISQESTKQLQLSLHLGYLFTDSFALEMVKYPNLTSLNLSNNRYHSQYYPTSGITDHSLEKLTQLKSLKVPKHSEITCRSIRKLTNLENLELPLAGNSIDYKSIKKLKKLTYLDLRSHNSIIPQNNIKTLKKKEIKKLERKNKKLTIKK